MATRNRMNVDERREQLLALALELFTERTYEEISIDEIAQKAGISKGLLYHYFPGKRAFYVAAVRHAAEELLSRTTGQVEAAREAGVEQAELLRIGLHAYLDFIEERATTFIFLMRGGMAGDPEVREAVDETRRAFIEVVLEGANDDGDPRVRTAVKGLIAFIEEASLDWLSERDYPREALAELVVRVGLATVAAFR